MDANKYQELAMRTNDGRSLGRLDEYLDNARMSDYLKNIPTHNGGELIMGTLGLVGESGEFADAVKKMIFHKHEMDLDILIKELGDVCWYVAMLCNSLNIQLEDVMQKNIDKLIQRYPQGFSEEASRNRQE